MRPPPLAATGPAFGWYATAVKPFRVTGVRAVKSADVIPMRGVQPKSVE